MNLHRSLRVLSYSIMIDHGKVQLENESSLNMITEESKRIIGKGYSSDIESRNKQNSIDGFINISYLRYFTNLCT